MPYMHPREVEDLVQDAIFYALDEESGIYDIDSIIRAVFTNSPVYYASNCDELEVYIRDNWSEMEGEALKEYRIKED